MNEPTSFPNDTTGDDPACDWALMHRVKVGDEDAFRELIERHQRSVIGVAARMLSDDTEAEDMAQQVFIRVWKSAARWEPTAKFTTWLYTILRNLVFNESRRRSKRPTRSLDAVIEEGDRPQQFEDTGAKPPDAALLDAELQEAVDRAISELPESQRMAIVLRRYQNVSYEEIAEVLELTVPAVKSVLFRARTELKEKLRVYLEA